MEVSFKHITPEIAERNQLEAYYVCIAWERFGGSFNRGLAQALTHADAWNVSVIKQIWKEEWDNALRLIETQPEYKGDL